MESTPFFLCCLCPLLLFYYRRLRTNRLGEKAKEPYRRPIKLFYRPPAISVLRLLLHPVHIHNGIALQQQLAHRDELIPLGLGGLQEGGRYSLIL